jgi:hypothetical protein
MYKSSSFPGGKHGLGIDAAPQPLSLARRTKKAGDASENSEPSPAVELERETGFEPATRSVGKRRPGREIRPGPRIHEAR